MAKTKKRKKKRQSAVRLQYMKERRRISNMVRRLRNKGYEITLRDIAGDIPKRVTKQALAKLKAIKSSAEAMQSAKEKGYDISKRESQEAKKGIPYMEDIAIQNFRDKFSTYHPEVEKIMNQWIDYVLKHFGEDVLIEALDDIEYEGIELSSYGGYLIPPGDLELYLYRISHFIYGDENSDLEALTAKVGEIMEYYSMDLTDAEIEEWGSWSFTGKRGDLSGWSTLSKAEKFKILKELGIDS